jgi:hypothetical protein
VPRFGVPFPQKLFQFLYAQAVWDAAEVQNAEAGRREKSAFIEDPNASVQIKGKLATRLGKDPEAQGLRATG